MKQCMDADNLHRRLKKIIGQVQAIDRMVDEDVPCEDILSQINAAKSALHKCGQIVLEGHIQHALPTWVENPLRRTSCVSSPERGSFICFSGLNNRALPSGELALRSDD